MSIYFTSRQLQVLSLIAKGYNNALISSLLYIQETTLERHMTEIYDKLRADLKDGDNMNMRAYAVRYYMEYYGNNGDGLREVKAKVFKDSSGRLIVEI